MKLGVLAAAALAAALVPPADAQKVGSRIPASLPLFDFAGTEAATFEEYAGRAILLEYFAHW